jgi:hypothetical protein
MPPGPILTSPPRRPRSTPGCMVTTTADRTSHWAWPTSAAVFGPAPIEPVPALTVSTEPLTLTALDVVVPPRPVPALPGPSEGTAARDVHAVQWETALTPRARLLLPGNQQLKFTAALAGAPSGPTIAASTSCWTER